MDYSYSNLRELNASFPPGDPPALTLQLLYICTVYPSLAFTVPADVPVPNDASQSWWRHQMETFSALLAICVGNSPVPGEFPAQRPVTRNFDVFFDLSPNKLLSKQSWGWWFETPSHPFWRHRNAMSIQHESHRPNTPMHRPNTLIELYSNDIFQWVFLNENVWNLINISLKFVPKGQIKIFQC